MKTLYLNIFPLVAGQGYPVSLGTQLATQPSNTDFLSELPVMPTGGALAAGEIYPKAIADIVRNARDPSPKFGVIGRDLFRYLLKSQAGKGWVTEMRAQLPPDQSENTLRTILNISAPELRGLPWELMLDESSGAPVFADKMRPVMHRSLVSMAAGADVQNWPLRVLVVVGSAAEDSIAADEEVEGIEKAMLKFGQLVELIVLRQPSIADFAREFTTEFRPHVFHFIGHGVNSSRGTVLRFSQGGDQDPTLEVGAIHTLVRGWAPRLVFLNACRSGDTPEAPQTLSDAFATRVPAVIAMRGYVRGKAAADFSEAFYLAFARGETADVAMESARSTIAAKIDFVDWGLPRLWLSGLPEEVLKMRNRPDDNERGQIAKLAEFAKLPRFINRSTERRKLCFGLDPIGKEERYRDLMVILGASTVGKSALLRYALAGCKLRGWKVVYATMGDNKTRSFIDTLRLIRGDHTITTGLARPTLEPAVFSTFNHQLNNLDAFARNQLPPQPAGVIREIATEKKIPDELLEDVAPLLAESFLRALQKAADQEPLVIALDQVKILENEFTDYFLKHFLARIAEQQWEPLRLLLVLNEEQKAPYKVECFEENTVKVTAFSGAEYQKLAVEFCRRIRPSEQKEKVAEFVRSIACMRHVQGTSWTGREFELIEGFLG